MNFDFLKSKSLKTLSFWLKITSAIPLLQSFTKLKRSLGKAQDNKKNIQPLPNAECEGGDLTEPQRGGELAGHLGQHVRAQQLQTREASKAVGPDGRKILQL